MADYWKSQPKKFCQYCKCWIADNKPSVDFHERGKNHKENVAAKIAEIKKKSVAKAKQEQKMSKEFAAMEEAALKAYEEDLKRLTAQSSGESLPPSPAPAKAPVKAPVKTPKKPKKRAANVPSEASSSSSSRPDVWVGGATGDGQVYYYNTTTGESRWEKPDGFRDSWSSGHGQPQDPSAAAWMEAVSPDGYMYYYNTETGQSSWEKPDGFSSEDICPPGVESPREVMERAENSSPAQPEPPSAAEDTPDPPKHTPEPDPDPEPDQTKQPSGPKISFRKKKEELAADDGGEKPSDDGGEKPSDDGGEKPSDDGGEKPSDDGGIAEEKEEDTSVTVAVKEVVTPVRRARKINPYGVWEKIQPVKDPYEKVDLQLPQVESFAPALPDVPPEPRPRFKERTITSLGDEGRAGATFKKRKTENGKPRILRQRAKDD